MSGPLNWYGYFTAVCELLELTWPDRDQIRYWRSASARTAATIWWMNAVQEEYLRKLGPSEGTPGWFKYPRDLQSIAFHLLRNAGDIKSVIRSLWMAMELSPALTTRCLLLAVALHQRSNQ